MSRDSRDDRGMNPQQRLSRRLVLAAGLACLVPALEAAEAGALAPDFDLPGVGDSRWSLRPFRGRLVYLDFWASWCGPCKLSLPWMADISERWGAQGLQVIAVNVDAKAADAQRFMASQARMPPVAFDHAGVTPRSFGVKSMPTSLLIDREGKILWRHAGFSAADREPLEQKIRTALSRVGGA